MYASYHGVSRAIMSAIFFLPIAFSVTLSTNFVQLTSDNGDYGFNIMDYQEGAINIITENRGDYYQASFNLPEGVVVTLLSLNGGESNCDYYQTYYQKSLDLIGTGSTKTYDKSHIESFKMDSDIGAFVWHTYNPSLGYIKVYDSAGYSGNWKALFINDFMTADGKWYSMHSFYMNQNIVSMDWSGLGPLVYMKFNNDESGGGDYTYAGAAGYKSPQQVDFSSGDDYKKHYKNNMKSFQWAFQLPDYVDQLGGPVTSFNLTADDLTSADEYLTYYTGVNVFDVSQQFSMSVKKTLTDSWTQTVSQSIKLGLQVGLTAKFTSPAAATTGGVKGQVSITPGATLSYGASKTSTSTSSLSIDVMAMVNITSSCNFNASLSVITNRLVGYKETVNYMLYFPFEVPGSVPNSNSAYPSSYYMIQDSIPFQLNGQVNYNWGTYSHWDLIDDDADIESVDADTVEEGKKGSGKKGSDGEGKGKKGNRRRLRH